MAEQFLHASEIGAAVEQVSGEAVPSVCGLAAFSCPASSKWCLEQPADASRRQARTPLVQETLPSSCAVLGLRSGIAPREPVHRHLADRAKSLAAALAANPHELCSRSKSSRFSPTSSLTRKPPP